MTSQNAIYLLHRLAAGQLQHASAVEPTRDANTGEEQGIGDFNRSCQVNANFTR